MLLDSSGLFVPSLAPGTKNCWEPSRGELLGVTKTGTASGYGLYGDFAPMRRAGQTVYVTSTFPWGKTQRATEVDTILAATHLPNEGIVHVSAAKGYAPFSFQWSAHWLTSPPTEPTVDICA